MELVFKNNGNIVTNSLLVAEKFGKEHKNVLRDIENLVAQNCAAKIYFIESQYENRGKSYPMFIMNQDGFSILVMGFTGSKALDFKLEYIKAFNQMKDSLKNSIENITKSDLAKMILESEEEKQTLLIQNARLKNRSDVFDKVFKADEYLTGSQVCKVLELGYGNVRLYKQLRKLGIFYKTRNEPMQEYATKKWIILKEMRNDQCAKN